MAPKNKLTIYLGTDHAAFRLKEDLRKYLVRSGYKVMDMGAFDDSPSDYPDFVIPAVESAVSARACAIVLGGSGIGECIAANKVRGARAALVYDSYTAKMSREHNNANVMCLGSRTATGNPKLAKRLVGIWLKTKFSAVARHERRLKKISSFEKKGLSKQKNHPCLNGSCVHSK